jgi:hypothetical protein
MPKDSDDKHFFIQTNNGAVTSLRLPGLSCFLHAAKRQMLAQHFLLQSIFCQRKTVEGVNQSKLV